MLALNTPDFSTASRLAAVVDGALGAGIGAGARPGDGDASPCRRTSRGNIPELMARIEPLPVESDMPARVVINERTGTVVIGAQVTLGAAAVAHGSLAVRISTRFDVSQPNAVVRPEPRRNRRRAEPAGRRQRDATRASSRSRKASRSTPSSARSTRSASRRATSSPSSRRSRPPARSAPKSSSSEPSTDTSRRPDSDS